MNARERIAYLRGLLDGMPAEEPHRRTFLAIADALSSLALEVEAEGRATASLREEEDSPDTSELRDLIAKLHGSVLELKDAILSDTLEDWDEEDGEDEEDGDGRALPDFASITCPFCSCSFYRSGGEGADDEVLCPECGRAIRGRADIDA